MSWDAVAAAILLRSQGLTAGLALVAVMAAVPAWRRFGNAPLGQLPGLGTAVTLGVIAGRLVWLASTAQPQLTDPIDFVRANTGIDMLSAAWVFALSSLWFGRSHASRLGEYAGWALLLGPAAYAAGCLLRRDCAGHTAPAPFGMSFEGYSELRLPIGLYEALALAFALALAVRFRPSLLTSPYPALALLGVVEWTIEFGRIGQLTRATFGIRSLWLVSSAAALVLAFARARWSADKTTPSSRTLSS